MSETGLRIRVYGEAVLKKKARPVKQATPAHRELLSKMARLMYEASGIGLAAPQVGVSECLIVVDIGNGLYKLVNPKIIKKEGDWCIEEGCLSVPGVGIKVKRSRKVVVSAWDENGKPLTIEAQDLLACVFQHEIDHLHGKLIVDYATLLDKLRLGKALKEMKGSNQLRL